MCALGFYSIPSPLVCGAKLEGKQCVVCRVCRFLLLLFFFSRSLPGRRDHSYTRSYSFVDNGKMPKSEIPHFVVSQHKKKWRATSETTQKSRVEYCTHCTDYPRAGLVVLGMQVSHAPHCTAAILTAPHRLTTLATPPHPSRLQALHKRVIISTTAENR